MPMVAIGLTPGPGQAARQRVTAELSRFVASIDGAHHSYSGKLRCWRQQQVPARRCCWQPKPGQRVEKRSEGAQKNPPEWGGFLRCRKLALLQMG
jgi:hypothetical protein